MKELKETLSLLQRATCPEDAFGAFTGSQNYVYMQAQKRFRAFAKITHPDLYQLAKDKEVASQAFAILGALWTTAEKKISQGLYGNRTVKPRESQKELVSFKTKKHTYVVAERIREGGMCGIFDGSAQAAKGQTSRVILKVPHIAKDNDLMAREAKALGEIDKKLKALLSLPKGDELARKFATRVPRLLESVKIEETGKKEGRIVNAFLKIPGVEKGWFTLEEIRKRYPEGIDPRVMCFIWNRVLEGLTLAHLSGVIHGAVTPNHVLIQANEHLGCLIDWTASCRTSEGDKVPYVDEKYKAYFPPEILSAGIPSPSSDIYMSAWCMVYVLGGNPEEKTIPDKVPPEIRELFNRCLQPKRALRPHSVDDLYAEFRRITKGLYGPRKFVE